MIRWPRNPRRADAPAGGWSPAVLALFMCFAAACAVTVVWGRTILDEGWYVYAGQLLARGRLPYRDFFFPQAPLAALIFVPTAPFDSHALWVARALCALMGLGAVAFTLRAARRVGGHTALVWTAALLMASYPFCHGLGTARSYAAVALLTAFAMDCLAGDRGDGRGWLLGTAVASLATAARPSIAPVVVVLWLVGIARWRGRALQMTAAAVLPVCAVVLPFAELGGERFWFGVFGFHAHYYGHSPEARGLQAAFWKGIFLEQPVALLVGAAALVLWVVQIRRTRAAPMAAPLRLAAVAFLSWILLLVVHSTRSAPFTHHQTMFLPLLAFASALTLSTIQLPSWANRLAPLAAWVLALAATPWQSWPGPPRWNGDGAPPRTMAAAALIREEARGRAVLTFDPILPLSAGSPAVDGYEAGVFAYWPRLPEARQLGGRSEADLRHLLAERTVPVLAFSMPDLRFIAQTSSPGSDLLRVLDENYRVVARVPRYGQWMDDLVIFRARGD